MNNKFARLLSVILCSALAFSGVSAGAVFDNNSSKVIRSTSVGSEKIMLSSQSDNSDYTKDETVYVLASSDGTVQRIIVSDWIKNNIGSDSIEDKSELSNAENIKGSETYTMNGDNMRVWDAKGNDIYYQGDIEKELPVGLSVSYTLDGKSISPNELAGKSGKVTIRFDYQNRQFETVDIDGSQERIYVPFVMLTGIILDNDVFTNVSVSNGKLLNDGDRTVIAGIAFPGLQHNLNIDKDKLEIPEYVEITADVKSFELSNTVTVAMNDVFSRINVDEIKSIDDLNSSLNQMNDAMNKLIDGSSLLYNGLCTLLDKSGELIAGIDKLTSGAKAIKDGAGDLYNGASALQEGATQLYSGLNTLASNNDAINGGATQVFESLLKMTVQQLNAAGLSVPEMTISNYAEVLNGIIASLDENAVYAQVLAAVTAAVEEQRPYITEQVTAAVRAEVEAQVTAAVREQVKARVTATVRENVKAQVIMAATGMDVETYEAAVIGGAIDSATQSAIEAQIESMMQSEEVRQLIESSTDEQMATAEVQAIITENVDAKMQTDEIKSLIQNNIELQIQKAIADAMASDEVQAKLKAASDGAQSVISLKASLDSYNAFYIGLQTYTAGVAEAMHGAGELKVGTDILKDGANKLYGGAGELYNGILTLKNGAPALSDGVTQLCDGAMQLSEGLKEFNEKGVSKLTEAVNGDIKGLVTRIRATVDVSKDYKSFSGIADGTDGQVKFIYRTDSVNIG